MTIRADAHLPDFHRGAPPQLPVRVATTANLTIASGLNAGDTVDGVTLAAGDRVLVKDQSTGAQNGVYIAGATPARSFDMSEGVAAWGAVIYVIAGTANGGKQFRNTNATLPTIDVTALTFAEVSGGGAVDYGETGDITTLDYDDAADAGALDEVARADHRHGMPSEGGGGGGGGGGGAELDYVEITSDVTISATTSATAQTVVTANPVTFDGTTVVLVEFMGHAETGSGGNLYAVLYDGSTELGSLGIVTSPTGVVRTSARMARRLTPSAGSHTYSVRGWRDTANGKWRAGAGTSGTFMPSYVRIVEAEGGGASTDGYGPDDKYSPDRPPSSGLTLSDEFDDSSLDGAWTWTTAPGGTVSESQFPGYLHIDGGTDSSGTTRYLRRAFAPGAGVAFAVASKLAISIDNGNYSVGIGIAVLDSSDAVIWSVQKFSSGTSTAATGHRILVTSGGTITTTDRIDRIDGFEYLLLTRDASNVYTAYASQNGIVWIKAGGSTVSSTVAKVAISYGNDTDSTNEEGLVDFVRVFNTATRKIGA